jgi:hypothetical protein
LEVERGGVFEVAIEYCLGDASERLEGSVQVLGGGRVSFLIREAFEGEVVWQPFVVEGEASKYASKSWATHELGLVEMPAGATTLSVKLDHIPGGCDFEVKSVLLRRVSE